MSGDRKGKESVGVVILVLRFREDISEYLVCVFDMTGVGG